MTGTVATARGRCGLGLDLRRAPLGDVQAIDFRAATRDFWADEAALWDRLTASWAGLDDAAWRLPGPPVGRRWAGLVAPRPRRPRRSTGTSSRSTTSRRRSTTGRWPTDDDYDGGDFDTFNERRRALFADVRAGRPAGAARRRARRRSSRSAGRLPLATIHSDAAWGWVYNVLHGHAIDHLRVLEPWAGRLRARQVQNDPFGPDPQPVASDLAAAKARFWADEASVIAQFESMIRGAARSRPGRRPR